MTPPQFAVRLAIAEGDAPGTELIEVPADTAERAVMWMRITGRRYAAIEPDDHPLWQWIEQDYPQTRARLELGETVELAFHVGEYTLTWTLGPAVNAETELPARPGPLALRCASPPTMTKETRR